VELDAATGRVAREYPFLLEESRVTSTSPALPIATAPNVAERRAPEIAADGRYVVQPGDTLAAIARATRPREASVEQTVVALYRANEGRFIDGNMNRLPVGAVLDLPPNAVITAIDPAEASRVILAHRTAAGAAAGAGPAPGRPAGADAVSRSASGDQLRVARSRENGRAGGATDPARGDDIVALQRALAEAQGRIALLERHIDEVRRQLASMGQQVRDVDPPERTPGELPILGAVTAEQHSDGARENGFLRDLAREHGTWLLVAFLLGFALWVVMPVKTARAWLNRRRHRERVTIQAALDLSRIPRHASATHFARLL
jgi:FimV-like protein